MTTVRQIRQRNLELVIREHFRGVAVDLARAMGVHDTEMSRARKGTRGGVPDKFARKVETAIGRPVGWLDVPHYVGAESKLEAIPKTRKGKNLVPLLSWKQALNPFLAEKPDVYIENYSDLESENLFALRVRGDSMESRNGGPSFPDGCVIHVDPDRQHRHGDFVVVQEPGAEEASLKQLQENPGATYLKPLNPQYEPTKLTADHRIVGVVVSMSLTF